MPAERTFADETLDTILVNTRPTPITTQPCGLMRILQQRPRADLVSSVRPRPPSACCAEGISVLTGRPTAYVQISPAPTQQIAAAIATAKNANAWNDED